MMSYLYPEDEVTFDKSGFGPLPDMLGSYAEEEANSYFELYFEYPLFNSHERGDYNQLYVNMSDYLIEGNQVTYKPSHSREPHAFRIYKTDKQVERGIILVWARTRTADLRGNPVRKVKSNGAPVSSALSALKMASEETHPFSFTTNIQSNISFEKYQTNVLDALVGEEDSILSLTGGQMIRTNNNIYIGINESSKNVVEFRLGKNIEGISYEVDYSNVVTAVIPFYTQTYKLVDDVRDEIVRDNAGGIVKNPDGSTKYIRTVGKKRESLDDEVIVYGDTVFSQYANDYSTPFYIFYEIRDDREDPGVDKDPLPPFTKADINNRAVDWFDWEENLGIDEPEVYVTVDIHDISQSSEYSHNVNLSKLETLNVFDKALVYVPEVGIDMDMEINYIRYDGVAEKNIEVRLGNVITSLRETMISPQERDFNQKVQKLDHEIAKTSLSSDGKARIYWMATKPIGEFEIGDLWFDVSLDGGIYVWDGYDWVAKITSDFGKLVEDSVNTAIETAEAAKQDAIKSYDNAVAETERLVGEQTTAFDNKFITIQNSVDAFTQSVADIDAKADGALEKAGANANLLTTHQNTIETINTVTLPDINSSVGDALANAKNAMDEAKLADVKIADFVTENGLVSGTTVDSKIDTVKGEISGRITTLETNKLDSTTYTNFYENDYKITAQGVTDAWTAVNNIVDDNGNTTDTFAKAVYDKNATRQSADFNEVTKDLVKEATYTAGINGLSRSITSVRGDLDSLSGGGRNYATDTSNAMKYYIKILTYSGNIDQDNKLTSKAKYTLSELDAKVGDWYTASIYIGQSGGFGSSVKVYNQDVNSIRARGNKVGHGYSSVTFQVLEGDTEFNFYLGNESGFGADYQIEAKEFQIEKGKIRTAWKPAISEQMGKAEFTIFKNDYDETAESVKRILTAVDSGKEGSIAYRLNETEKTASGNTTTISDIKKTPEQQITGYQTIKERSELYERVIGKDEAVIKSNMARMVMTDSLFKTEVIKNVPSAIGGRNYVLKSNEYYYTNNYKVAEYDLSTIPKGTKIKISLWGALSSNVRTFGVYINNANGLTSANSQKIELTKLDGTYGQGVSAVMSKWTAEATLNVDAKKILIYGLDNNSTSPKRVEYVQIETGDYYTDWTAAPEDKASMSAFTQLENAIDLKVSDSELLSRINVQAGGILITSGTNKLNITPETTYIEDATIKSAMIYSIDVKKITGIEADFTKMVTKGLTANVIKSEHVNATVALVNKIFSEEAYIKALTSKTIFANQIKAIEISASKITTGELDGSKANITNIDAKNITANQASLVQAGFKGSSGGSLELNGDQLLSTASNGSQVYLQNGVMGVRRPPSEGGGSIGQIGYVFDGGSPTYTIQTSWGSHFALKQRFYDSYTNTTNDKRAMFISTGDDGVTTMQFYAADFVLQGNRNLRFGYDHYINGIGNDLTLTGKASVTVRANERTIFVVSSNGTNNYASLYANLNMNGSTVTNTSDIRLKRDIVNDEIDSLSALMKWQHAGFNYINPDMNQERQFSVIAQSAPDLAFAGEDGYLQVALNKQVNMTSHALQQHVFETRDEIAQLKEQIITLKEELSLIKGD